MAMRLRIWCVLIVLVVLCCQMTIGFRGQLSSSKLAHFSNNLFSSSHSWIPITRLSARKTTKDSASSSSSIAPQTPSDGVAPTVVDPAKLEALQGVLHSIERSYGKGSIQKLGQSPTMTVETTSSGSLTLDVALGGGYPKGRVIEIYGPESSGKTTLALHAVAEIQKNGGMAAFVDAEHALDPVYARNLGVKVDDLFVCQPDSGEMALDVVDQLVRSSAFDLIVIDSVAALVPRVELEGDMQDQQMGLQARLMSKALRKITGSLSRSQTSVLFLNQLRSKIGIMFGNPEVTAGGNALKFYASVRLDIRRKEILKDNSGINVRVKVVKNKVAPPFRSVDFDIYFGSGIDKIGCVVDAAELTRVLVRKGAWYYHGEKEETLAQGRRSMVEYCESHPEFYQQLITDVKRQLHLDAQQQQTQGKAQQQQAQMEEDFEQSFSPDDA